MTLDKVISFWYFFSFSNLKISPKLVRKRQNLSTKCTKNRVVAGLRPDPLGELTALPQGPLAGYKGGLGPPGAGRDNKEEREGERKGKKGREKGGEEGHCPPDLYS